MTFEKFERATERATARKLNEHYRRIQQLRREGRFVEAAKLERKGAR